VDGSILTDPTPLACGVGVDAILQQMVDAAQLAPHSDRPGDGGGADPQDALDFIEQLYGWPAIAIELVDEGHDRCVAQAADLHELDGPLLHSLGAIDDHQ